jgi:hypothetical protein
LGKSVSSAGVRSIIVGGGNGEDLAEAGYMPANTCCIDSSARGIGVARRYIESVLLIVLGMNPS